MWFYNEKKRFPCTGRNKYQTNISVHFLYYRSSCFCWYLLLGVRPSVCINCINPSLHNNKRLMGHISHQRNSSNHLTNLCMIWLYYNVDLGRKKTLSPFQKLNDLYLFKVKSPSPKGAFLVEIGGFLLEKKIFKFRQFFFLAISLLSSLGKGRGPSFE